MRKTKTFCTLILMLFLCTCTQNLESPLNKEDLDGEIKNKVAINLLKFLKEKPEVYSQLTRALNENKPEYEHAVLSASQRFGNYYCVPYSQNGVIRGCMIYPVSCNGLGTGEYLITGLTGEVISMDNDYLNNAIPDDERYLYSVHFLNWERRDNMKVNPTLTAYARLLELNSKPSPSYKIESNISTRSALSEWTIANVHMNYQTSDIHSGIEIIAPNLLGLIGWMEDFLNNKTKPRGNINEFQVYRRWSGSVEIDISFDGYVDIKGLHYLMHDLILYVNSIVYNNSHCYFEATYTYDIQNGISGGGGGGSTGGGGVSGGSGELPPPPPDEDHDKPDKVVDATIKCNDTLSTVKNKLPKVMMDIKSALEDPKYDYIRYTEYLDAVEKDPTREHTTSLYEFEDPEDGKFYKLNHVRSGNATSAPVNTGENVIAIVHNHPNETPPSFRDALLLARNAEDKLEHSFIYLPNKHTYYVLSVTDKQKAKQFEMKYRGELNTETNWVRNDGALKGILDMCDNAFIDLGEDGQMIFTLERIFSECDAGITISEFGGRRAVYWSEKTITKDEKGKEEVSITIYTCE